MKLKERQKIVYKYNSKIHSDETIDKVIELFYTLKDNRSGVIAEMVGIKAFQVLKILNQFDDNVKNFDKERL